MAGRPKGMIRKLAELERQAVELAKAVRRVMPCMYEPTREAGECHGEIEMVWRTIRVVTADLPTLLCMLGFFYRCKAGLDDGGPIQFACKYEEITWLAQLLPIYGPMVPAPERPLKPSELPPKPPEPAPKPANNGRSLEEILRVPNPPRLACEPPRP